MLETPQEDLTTLASVFEASGRVTRRQFHLLTDPMLRRHRLVYALEWLPFVRDVERTYHEAEASAAGLAQYRFWEQGPDGKARAASRRRLLRPDPLHGAAQRARARIRYRLRRRTAGAPAKRLGTRDS